MRRQPAPPKLGRLVVRRCVPPGIEGRSIVGDLHEEFFAILEKQSLGKARAWYWRQALDIAVRMTLPRVATHLVRSVTSWTPGRRLAALLDDARYGARIVTRAPGVSLVAIASIALGVAATSSLFSVVDAVLLRSLPYTEPQRLVRVAHSHAESGATPGVFSPQDYEDLESTARSFAGWAAYWYTPGQSVVNVAGGDEPVRAEAAFVSQGFFSLLGTLPAVGRPIVENDMGHGRDRVAVLSHSFWRSQFGADERVGGSEVLIDGEAFDVIGVMPESFRYPSSEVRVWIPVSRIGDDDIPHVRGLRWLDVIARLGPGTTIEAAQAEVNAMVAQLAIAYPDTNESWARAELTPLRAALVGDSAAALWLVFGATLIVLLMIGANLAALLLARGASRAGDVAVRIALGASRARIASQVLAESLVLSLLGGVVGVLMAYSGIGLLVSLSAGTIPRAEEIGPDLRLVAFALIVSVASGVSFGLLPALRSTKVAPADAFRGSGGEGSRVVASISWLRGLVVAEAVLATLLAVGAGLLLRSFGELLEVDPGFDADRVLSLSVSLRDKEYEDSRERKLQVQRELLEAIGHVPGVVAVGGSKTAPLAGGGEPYRFTLIEADGKAREVRPASGTHIVTPGYFDALGVPFQAGRDFAWHEPRAVVIVNATLAQQLWPGQRAVGRSLFVGESAIEVVGVVADLLHDGLTAASIAALYVSSERAPRSNLEIFVRAAGDPLAVASGVRQSIRERAETLPIANLSPLSRKLGNHVAEPRFFTLLLVSFGLIAVAIAALGLYGVLSYGVSQRVRELGIRQALGATSGDLRRMIVGQAVRLVGLGVTLGLLASLWLGRGLRSLLFGVGPHDPTTLIGVTITLAIVAVAASYGPARRATRQDPAVALRSY